MHSDPIRSRGRRLLQAMLIISLALTSGCAKFMYDRLDSLAGWYIGNLVTLDGEQRADLHAFLSRTHAWHRASQLGQYAGFLHEMVEHAAAPLDRATYMELGRRVEAFGDALVERAAPDAVRLLRQLSPAQLAELEANLERRGRERARDSQKALQKGTWAQERAHDLRRQLKRWTGAVTDEQRTLLARNVAELEPTTEDWLASQRQWRQALHSALQPTLDEPRILALLRTPEIAWTADYVAKNERNRERSLDMIVALDQSLTPAQRAHLQKELQHLAARVDALRSSQG